MFAFHQSLFGQLALGDVPLDGHKVRDRAVVVREGNNIEVHPVLVAVFLVVDQLGTHRLHFFERRADAVQLGTLRFGSLQKARRFAKHLLAAVAGTALERIIDKHNARTRCIERTGFGDQHNVIQARHGRFQQLQLALGLLLLGDVLQCAHQPHDFAVLLQSTPLKVYLAATPAGRHQRQDQVAGLAVINGRLQSRANDGLRLRGIKTDRLLKRRVKDRRYFVNAVNLV